MKNQKNRFGENVGFDERANEESYFALREHERIEEMKVDFQNAEAAKKERQIGSCPTCPGKLEKYPFIGFMLNRCDRCEGIWLKPDELRSIVRQAARGPIGAFLDRCFSKHEPQEKG
jgi:Zn-finger nucleic acid-binding protein